MSIDSISLSKIVAASRNQLYSGFERVGLKKAPASGKDHYDEFAYTESYTPLETQLYPLSKQPADSQFYPHVVHRFGPHNILGYRTEILNGIAQLKVSLKHYQSLLMATKNNPDAAAVNQAFSRLNFGEASSILEEEARRAQRQNNMNFRLSQARRRIAYHLEPSCSPADFYTMTLKTMARDLKLDHFTDDHDNFTTMMICGKLIVLDVSSPLDILIDEIDISTAGDILKVKVTHPNDENFSEKIDKMMLEDLKSYNMVGVYLNIAALAALDGYSFKNPQVDFLHVFRALGHDLEFIYQMELNSVGGDLPTHLRNGHGIPLTHYKHWGPSLICWSPPSPDFPPPAPEIHNWLLTHELPKGTQLAYFELDSVGTSHPFLPPHISGYYHPATWTLDPSDQLLFNRTELPFQPPCAVLTHTTPSVVAPLQWAFVLDPPLLAFQTISYQLCGLPVTSAPHNKDMPRFRDLMLDSVFSDHGVGVDPSGSYFDSDSFWVASLKSCPVSQRYRMLKNYNPISCQTVHRVPFSHPQELNNILQAVRQQSIFNSLFKSCFNPTNLLGSEVACKLTSVDVEFSMQCQPMSISVRFPCPKEHVTLTFSPQLRGPPVAVDINPAAEYAHLSESITHLLANSLNIPLTVGYILKKFATPI